MEITGHLLPVTFTGSRKIVNIGYKEVTSSAYEFPTTTEAEIGLPGFTSDTITSGFTFSHSYPSIMC